MRRRRNRFQTLARQTMASLKGCSEEVKRDSGEGTDDRKTDHQEAGRERTLDNRGRKESGEVRKPVRAERQAAREGEGERDKERREWANEVGQQLREAKRGA